MNSNSRKILHLRRQRSLPPTFTMASAENVTSLENISNNSLGQKNRVIQIRYRCGKTVTSADAEIAVDMRKNCFLSTSNGMQN